MAIILNPNIHSTQRQTLKFVYNLLLMQSLSELNNKNQKDLSDFHQFLEQQYKTRSQKINIGTQYQRQVGQEGMKMLVQHCSWDIELLNVSLHNIKDEGMQVIIQSEITSPQWANLRQFAAFKNDLTSESLKDLPKIKWQFLNSINLRQNRIDFRGIELIVNANFSNLKVLLLGSNVIKTAGCEILSRSNWPLFEYIDLNFNQICNQGLAFLILAKWPNLKEINLANNKLDAQATYYLEKADWPQLHSLQLSRNNIGVIHSSEMTDLGCLRISRMKTTFLKYFGFQVGNNISLNGIRILMRSKIFAKKCILQLTKNQFKFEEIRGYLNEFNLFCDQFQE